MVSPLKLHNIEDCLLLRAGIYSQPGAFGIAQFLECWTIRNFQVQLMAWAFSSQLKLKNLA